MKQVKKSPRKVNFTEAAILMIAVVAIMFWAAMVVKIATGMGIIICAVVIGSYCWLVLGYSWKEMFEPVLKMVSSSMPAIYFLILTGFVCAAWIASGTVPYMIYLGLKIISPKIFLFATFTICWIASMATGSSWAIVTSVGLALAVIGQGLGVNIAITTGAIVSGCFMGDKWSPLSDTPNLAAAVNKRDIMAVFIDMIPTSGLASILTAIVFLIQGFLTQSGGSNLGDISTLMSNLASAFHFNILLLLPLVFVIVLCVLKLPPIPVVFGGVLVAMIEAMIFQGTSLKSIIGIVWSGYKATTNSEVINNLLSRGGCLSMGDLLLLLMMCYVMAGFLSQAGVLDAIGVKLSKLTKTSGSLILTSLLTSVAGVFMTASVYVSIILNTELYRESYASVGLDDVDLARTTLEGTAMLGGMVPWSNGALLVIATTGAAAWSYFPFCYGCWASMILLVMWGFMGKHLTKRKVIGDEAKPEPIEV